jgi:hypothetical protein
MCKSVHIHAPQTLFFYYKFFVRIYSLYGGRGGFVVTIPIRLILYIIYIAPIQTLVFEMESHCVGQVGLEL